MAPPHHRPSLLSPSLPLLLALLGAGCPSAVPDPCPGDDPCPPDPTPGDDDDTGSLRWDIGPLTGAEDHPRGCEGIVGTPGLELGFRPIASFVEQTPVDIVDPGDGTDRVFVVSHQGVVLSLSPSGESSTLIDLQSETSYPLGGEIGMYSVAPHPGFSVNGHVYLSRSDLTTDVVVERYTVAGDPASGPFDPTTRLELLRIPQPTDVHHGGQLVFGSDGMLYIGIGDGGPTQGANGASQELTHLRGKILRIDVDGGTPYAIPADNPTWPGANARGEIWALGLRNPWRFSFDPQTGAMWIGDVGENRFEEVNIGRKGANYGWPVMEGDDCYPSEAECDPSLYEAPTWVYSHIEGVAVIGGHVYRGCTSPDLWGTYIFSDFGDLGSPVWSLSFDGLTMAPGPLVPKPYKFPLFITTWGVGGDGELYVGDRYGNQVLKVVPGAEAGRF